MTIALTAETMVFFILTLGAYALNSLCNEMYSNMSKGPTWKPVVAFVTLSLAQIDIAIITFWLKVRSKIFQQFATQYSRYLVDCCRDGIDYDVFKEAMEQWRSNDQSRSMNDLEMNDLEFIEQQDRIPRSHRYRQFKDAVLLPFCILMLVAPGTIVINLLTSYITDLLKNEGESTKVFNYIGPVLIQIAVGFVWWRVKGEKEKAFEKFQSHVKNCSPDDYEQLKRDIKSQWCRAESGDATELEHLTDRDSQSAPIGDMHSQASEANDDTQVQKGAREPISQPLRRRGSGGASSGPPAGITKLNDSVWELYSPSTTAEMDIVFYHGLQMSGFDDAFWTTWLAEDEEELVWPQHWLRDKIPKARILAISYESSATRLEAHPDISILGEDLVADIILGGVPNIGQNCPVFLVGHSLGGIVIKSLILSAMKENIFPNSQPDIDKEKSTLSSQRDLDRMGLFLQNVKGIFYYGTPNGGSQIEKLAEHIPSSSSSPILKFLERINSETGRINEAFGRQRGRLNAQAFAVAESQPTLRYGFGGMVVQEGSARQDVDNFYTNTFSDHFTVCKARSMDDPVVIGQLTRFILGAMREGNVMRPGQDELEVDPVKQPVDPNHLQ